MMTTILVFITLITILILKGNNGDYKQTNNRPDLLDTGGARWVNSIISIMLRSKLSF